MGVLVAGVNVMGIWWAGVEGMGLKRLAGPPATLPHGAGHHHGSAGDSGLKNLHAYPSKVEALP
jgi:hypothetical protein